MSQEIAVNASLVVSKTNYPNAPLSISGGLFTWNGTTSAAGAASIPTTANGTAVSTSNITTAGWAWFKNCDATNFVQIGTRYSGWFVPFLKLSPGEIALSRIATTSIYALADTAAVVLDYRIYND